MLTWMATRYWSDNVPHLPPNSASNNDWRLFPCNLLNRDNIGMTKLHWTSLFFIDTSTRGPRQYGQSVLSHLCQALLTTHFLRPPLVSSSSSCTHSWSLSVLFNVVITMCTLSDHTTGPGFLPWKRAKMIHPCKNLLDNLKVTSAPWCLYSFWYISWGARTQV